MRMQNEESGDRWPTRSRFSRFCIRILRSEFPSYLPRRPPTRAPRPRRAAEAVRPRDDAARLPALEVERLDRHRRLDLQIQHLVEIAVEEAPVPRHGERVATHEARDRRGVEAADEALHVRVEIVRLHEPLQEARDRHVVQRQEAIERDAEVALERRLPFPFDLALRRREKRAGGIHHQGQLLVRIALAVADAVEQPQRFDRFVECAVAALRVGVALPVVRQRRHDLHALRRQPLGEAAVAPQEQHRQVAAVDDVLSPPPRLGDEVAKVGMELGRAAGEVDDGRIRPIERAQAGLDRLVAHHRVGAVRTGVDVTMRAGHVAELADVDLEDEERVGPERGPAGVRQRLVERGPAGQHRQLRRGIDAHIPTSSACSFLHPVHQRRAAADGAGHVHGLGHLLEVGAFLQTLRRVRVDAVRALHGVRDGERDQGLLARGERAGGEDGVVVVEEFLRQLRRALGDVAESLQVVDVIIVVRQALPPTPFYVRLLRALAVPLALLMLWEALSRAGVINPIILPSPSRVVLKWLDYAKSGELPRDAASSLYRVAMGFLIGTALALPLGLAMGASRRAYALLNPVLQVLRPIPPIAYVPLAILWFGLGNPPAFFLISLGAFFPVLMSTVAGVRSVDAIY